MAVESNFSESLAGRNKRETEVPKRKPRSILSFCSGRSTNPRPPAKSRFRCLRVDPPSSSGSSSPEKPSPLQMLPHFMKATASYDAKKENSQGGIECDDVESFDSSISANHDSKIKNMKGDIKGIKKFGSKRSFRKGRSRIMKPTAIQEASDSSPNHTKAASCSEGKKGDFQESAQDSVSSFDSSDQSSQSNLASYSASSVKSFQTLMRSSSLRGVRLSFKSRKRSVNKATCSSTIKNSKFPEKIELLPGKDESERLSVYKVCSYHHCSLHGHSHDSSSAPPKRAHPRRKWSKPRNKSTGTKELVPIETSQISPKPTVYVTEDSSVRENTQSYEGISGGGMDADLVEVIFGETSFPEKNYEETLNQIGKAANWCCSCNSSKDKVDSEELRENREEIDTKSEPDKGLIVKPATPSGELEPKNLPQLVDSMKAPTSRANKEKHLSMWNLIMSGLAAGSDNKPLYESDEANCADDSNKLPAAPDSSMVYADVGTEDQDGENQEIEVRNLFAIKLVREAIEKILLPEIPDQSSDDQSVTSETSPDQEILENNTDNASAQESSVITDRDGCEEEVKTRREVATKSERKAPKHWSNLKKWILLQRFIKELEKVKKINPRKPRQLELEHNPEAEKVHLRAQVVDEKRRTEEWMLDYALRQAISQLAPTQRRKVDLLVRAFETVVPPQGGNNTEVTLPKLKSNNSEEHLPLQMPIKDDKFSSEANQTIYQAKEVLSEADGSEKLQSTKNILEETERKREHQPEVFGGNSLIESMSECKGNNGADTNNLEKRKYISMWHMISQHVLSGVVSKAGTELLDGTDDEVEDAITVEETKQDLSKPHDDKDAVCENHRRNFSRDDAIKLVREVVNEILVTQVQDDSSDAQSVTSDILPEQELPVMNQIGDGEHSDSALSEENSKECNKTVTIDDSIIKRHEKKEVTLAKAKPGLLKSKNWSMLKKLFLLKRSIMALESARKLKFPPRKDLPQTPNPEPEKVDLRHQMTDERKKAEQWMLDYAVQNIVTKLTPARKRRVAMLVEAFESVVPLPEE